HTNSKRLFEFLSQFTDWRFYEHRVLADIGGKQLPIPINRTTINGLYNLNLDEEGVAKFFERVREPISPLRSSEDVVLNTVGRELCETFFKNYTFKQWGISLGELSPGVTSRIPTRTNDDDRYFTDTYQFMPKDGYTRLFLNILDHRNIKIELERPFDHQAR